MLVILPQFVLLESHRVCVRLNISALLGCYVLLCQEEMCAKYQCAVLCFGVKMQKKNISC